MCDYSLHHVGSRPAQVNDKVFTMELARSHARGFAAVGEVGAKLVVDEVPPNVAVCLLPGTELCFDDDVRYDRPFSLFGKARLHQKLARFRQVDLDNPRVQHDALEFPDGRVVKVSRLAPGQTARVLQLPVTTSHADHQHEHHETRRAARASESRLAMNRVASKPGLAAILMPSQNTVMLWRTCRSTAARLSLALEESFRRLAPHKQGAILETALPAAGGAAVVGANAKQAAAPPSARKPDKGDAVRAAA